MKNSQRQIGLDDFFKLAQATLAAGASLQFRARGYSMQPQIFDGDLLLLSGLEQQRLRVGDVLCARSADGQACVHRLVAIKDKRVLLRADAGSAQAWFQIDDVLGRVRLIKRKSYLRWVRFKVASALFAFLAKVCL